MIGNYTWFVHPDVRTAMFNAGCSNFYQKFPNLRSKTYLTIFCEQVVLCKHKFFRWTCSNLFDTGFSSILLSCMIEIPLQY